jgi:hypothetical protein
MRPGKGRRSPLKDYGPFYEVAARQLWLTAFVFLEGIRWCPAVDRMRDMMGLTLLTWGLDARTLLPSKERPDTILILHEPCHNAPL